MYLYISTHFFAFSVCIHAAEMAVSEVGRILSLSFSTTFYIEKKKINSERSQLQVLRSF